MTLQHQKMFWFVVSLCDCVSFNYSRCISFIYFEGGTFIKIVLSKNSKVPLIHTETQHHSRHVMRNQQAKRREQFQCHDTFIHPNSVCFVRRVYYLLFCSSCICLNICFFYSFYYYYVVVGFFYIILSPVLMVLSLLFAVDDNDGCCNLLHGLSNWN